MIPPFFFLSPPKKRGQTKKARISPRSSPNGYNCRRRLLAIPLFASIIVQGRKRIKRVWPCVCVFFKLFPHIWQRPAARYLRAFLSVFMGGGPVPQADRPTRASPAARVRGSALFESLCRFWGLQIEKPPLKCGGFFWRRRRVGHPILRGKRRVESTLELVQE